MSKRKTLRIVLGVAIALKSGMVFGGQVSPTTPDSADLFDDNENENEGNDTQSNNSQPAAVTQQPVANSTTATATQPLASTTPVVAPAATTTTNSAVPVALPNSGDTTFSSQPAQTVSAPAVSNQSPAATTSTQEIIPLVSAPANSVNVAPAAPESSAPFTNTPVAPVSNLNTTNDQTDQTATVRTGIETLGATPDNRPNVTQNFDNDDAVISTVDSHSASGNWVYKNYWWRKIEEVYGDIKESLNKIMTSRMIFFTQRNEVDKELDRFYQQVGLEQGQLQDILNVGLELMEKEQKEQGFLNAKERALFDKIKDRKRQLEQLKADVKAIEDLDNKIDEAIDIVLKQGDVCSKYEQQAWEIFKSVARELSDKEAQKQYYVTQTLLEDTHKVHEYLMGDFTHYFQQMIQSVKEHTQSIVAQLTALDKEGVSLKKELEIFEREDESSEKEEFEKKRKAQEKLEQEKKEKASGFMDKVSSSVTIFVGWLGNLVETVKGFFVSPKKDKSQIAATGASGDIAELNHSEGSSGN